MHLIVLHHGWLGSPECLRFLEKKLLRRCEAEHKDRVRIVNVDANAKVLSHDGRGPGIDVCGERALEAIADHLDEATAISLVGYSMGGLIVRYLAGRLLIDGWFDRGLTPVHLVTIATPNLGAIKPTTGLYNRAFNALAPRYALDSGKQMFLQDDFLEGMPLLEAMADPNLPFYKALQRFQIRTCYANVYNDDLVPYQTAAIRMDDPYQEQQPSPVSERYPSIVRPADPAPHLPPRPLHPSDARAQRVATVLAPVLVPLYVLLTSSSALYGWAHRSWYRGRSSDRSANRLAAAAAHHWLRAANKRGSAVAGDGGGGWSGEEDGPSTPRSESPVSMSISSTSCSDSDRESSVGDSPSRSSVDSAAVTGRPPKAAAAWTSRGGKAVAKRQTRCKVSLMRWMADRLNELHWEKVDVDTRRLYAHGAIIARHEHLREECENVVQHIVDHFQLA